MFLIPHTKIHSQAQDFLILCFCGVLWLWYYAFNWWYVCVLYFCFTQEMIQNLGTKRANCKFLSSMSLLPMIVTSMYLILKILIERINE